MNTVRPYGFCSYFLVRQTDTFDKVNFCLFCAKNVLGLGVEFFALFQDGLTVVVVVDGIGPKLCFQAKTATLGVVGFSQLSAKKVSAVKLYAGHIGVAIQRDTRFY